MAHRRLCAAGSTWCEHLTRAAGKNTRISRGALLLTILVVFCTALILLLMGREPICKCGYVKFWQGEVFSAENSQHISDWYTFSHVIHGFVFFGLLWLAGHLWPIGLRLVLASLAEAGWEIFENTDFIINRYREATISLDYYGDSVVNSASDILAMILGFCLAARLDWRITLLAAIAMELVVGSVIRDNLTLNIIMLVWPLDSIKNWQAGA